MSSQNCAPDLLREPTNGRQKLCLSLQADEADANKLGAGVALIDLINELVEHPISMSDDE
jgi:hypothetical protein